MTNNSGGIHWLPSRRGEAAKATRAQFLAQTSGVDIAEIVRKAASVVHGAPPHHRTCHACGGESATKCQCRLCEQVCGDCGATWHQCKMHLSTRVAGSSERFTGPCTCGGE